MNDTYNLKRFLEAQNARRDGFDLAMNEIRSGRKMSHWIWYIFPQLKGLGRSAFANYYGISGIDEARAYLSHRVLGKRLRRITEAFCALPATKPEEVLGGLDAMKVMSSLTLFDAVEPGSIFAEALRKYYGGEKDEFTLGMLNSNSSQVSSDGLNA